MTSDTGVTISGGKTGILLLHDVGGSASDLLPLAQALARVGFSVSCPRLGGRAAGSTERGPDGAGLWLSEADGALFRLKDQCESIVVAGCGYGAILAVEVARSNPDAIQALVLLEPRIWLPAWPGRLASALAGRLPQVWLARLVTLMPRQKPAQAGGTPLSFLKPAATNSASSPPADLIKQVALLLDSAQAAFPSVGQPALLIQKQTTRHAGLASAIALQRQLGGRVESIVIDDGNLDLASGELGEAIAERTQRFAAVVSEEIETRRSNELRRQRVARSSAA